MTENPKVTIAKNHAFSLTQVRPIRKPMPAERKPPTKMPIIGGIPRGSIASNAETNPPIPRNAACPREP